MLVVNGKVVACAERVPARVFGDGTKSVRALIEQENRDPRRGIGHTKILTHLPTDERDERTISRRRGSSMESVPAKDEQVSLRQTANLSTGGTSIDRTDEMHPDNVTACEMAAAAIGLDIAGIDVITADISVPFRENGAVIIEVNAGPGIRMHTHPTEGDAAQRRRADRGHALSARRGVDDPGHRGDGDERQDDDDAAHRAPLPEHRADRRLHDDGRRLPRRTGS